MNLIQRSEDARALWCAIVDHTLAPEDRQFDLWARRFTDAQIERAFMKVDRKFANLQVEPETVWRYTTGLLLNLEREGIADRGRELLDRQPVNSLFEPQTQQKERTRNNDRTNRNTHP